MAQLSADFGRCAADCLPAGFWKFFGHGPKEAVAAGWWLKATAAGFTLLLSETLRRVIEVFEAQEEQQKELHQGRF